MEFPSTPDATRPGGEAPHVSASQASALLRSAMAISSELIGASFPDITKALLEEMSGKWDFDVGSPLVQRHLSAKGSDLQHVFMQRLQETQDQFLNELTIGRTQGPAPALDAETLSLVDSVSVESNAVVDRHASKAAGYADHPLRDLNLVVGFLLGRGAVRMSENPLGPSVYMRALLLAAEETKLHDEAWDYFLTLFEKPFGEELARIVRQLLDHFGRHGVDVRAIRRTMAPKSSGSGFSGTMPGGLTSPAAWTGGSATGTTTPGVLPGGAPGVAPRVRQTPAPARAPGPPTNRRCCWAACSRVFRRTRADRGCRRCRRSAPLRSNCCNRSASSSSTILRASGRPGTSRKCRSRRLWAHFARN